MKVIYLALIINFVCCVFASSNVHVPVTHPDVYFTEQNWFIDKVKGIAQTANPGAYIKFGFTGSQVSLMIDLTGAPLTKYAKVGFSVDGGPEKDLFLPDDVHNDVLILDRTLSTNHSHTLFLYYANSNANLDRWYLPSTVFRIKGIILDKNAVIVPHPHLQPHRMMVYWDSIGEGVNVLGRGDRYQDNNARMTWSFPLAAAIQSEVSVVAWGAQGWTRNGAGNIPFFFSEKSDGNSSTWDYFDANHKRTFESCPEYIFCGHGTNDGLHDAPDEQVFKAVTGWLPAQRKVCPKSLIFLVIPFGGFEREIITKAFETYQGSAKDQRTILINLGVEATIGLNTHAAEGTFYSSDGIHPYSWRDGQLGAMLAVAAIPHIH